MYGKYNLQDDEIGIEIKAQDSSYVQLKFLFSFTVNKQLEVIL